MSSGKYFSGMPSINIPRSKWNTNYNVTGSYKHGYLNVIDAIPVLPGDSISLSLKDLTRMQTPIAPIFGNIKQHFAAFFVPERLLWEHTEEHYGANKTSAGYQTTTYTKPVAKFRQVDVGSLSHQLGKPLIASGDSDADGKTYYAANCLKERAYYLIWNEYFRAQQITNPCLISKGDVNENYFADQQQSIGTWNGSQINPGAGGTVSLMKVAKDFDCFTACTLRAQYGSAVELPLGTVAPIRIESSSNLAAGNYNVGFAAPGATNKFSIYQGVGKSIEASDITNVGDIDVYADLSHATAAKVNDVRYAFAVQKYLERANFSGNYFFGILQVHYGVTSPDSRLQRPEFLGTFEEDILVHQVVSTADTVNSGVKTSVGNTGAMSVTASGLVNLFNKAFVEPGFVVLVRYCRHRQVYSQGVMKEDFVKDRFETYTPELCNLGDDAVKTRELYWKAGETEPFGFQEMWYQYRYRYDRVCGMLDPNGPAASTLPFWTLANAFTTKPQLNDDFIMESRDNLDRALVTGSSYDEYISDTFINLTLTREMPVRTIPGLIDHFGAM